MKGFCDIIDSAAAEKVYFVIHIDFCAYDDNGGLFDLGQEFFAVQAGEH